MKKPSTISILKEWVPQPALPWLVRALKLDPLLWTSMQNEKFMGKMISIPWSPESTLPISIALRCADADLYKGDYHQLREKQLPENIRDRCFRTYESLLDEPQSSTSFVDAAFLALGLNEHHRESGKWENPSGNVYSIFSANHGLPDVWQSALNCLFSLLNSSQDLLHALHKAGLPVDVIIKTLLSSPQPLESHLEILEQFLNDLDVASQLAFIKKIHLVYPELAIRISEEVTPKEYSYHTDLTDVPSVAKSVADETILTQITSYSKPNQDSLRSYLKLIEQNNELNAALVCNAAKHAIRCNQIQTGLRLTSRLSPPITKKLITPVTTLILTLFTNGLTDEAGELNDRMFPRESAKRHYVENHPILLLNRALLAADEDDLATAYAILQHVMKSINNKANMKSLNGFEDLFFETLIPFMVENQWYSELLTTVQIAQELDPENPEYIKWSASLLREQMDEDQINPKIYRSIDSLEYSTVLHPERIDLVKELASTLEAAGDFRRAQDERTRVIEAQASPNIDDLNLLAYTAIRAGDLDLAETAGKRSLNIKPDYAPTLVCMANVYRHKENYELAEEYFNQAAALTPNNEDVWLGLADLYHDLGDHKNEHQSLQTAVQAMPQSARILYRFGECTQENNTGENALSIFEKALNAAKKRIHHKGIPLLTKIRMQIGQIYQAQGELDKAERVFEDAFLEAPQHLTLAKQYADVLLQNGKTQKAVQPLATVVQAEPLDPQVYLDYLHALIDSGLPSAEAFHVLERLKALQPDLPEITGYEAELLAAGEQFENAYTLYKQALESSLVDDPAWKTRLVLGLGISAMQIDEPETALAALQAAKEVAPKSLDVNRALTDGYINSGLNDEALQSALTTKSLAPDNVDNLAWFARKSIQLEKFSHAIQAYQQAVELVPDRKDLEIELAQIYRKQGDFQQAKQYYRSVIEYPKSSAKYLMAASDGLMVLDQPHSAIDGYLKAVDQLSDTAEDEGLRSRLYEKLYNAHMSTQDYPAALEALELVSEIQGSNSETIIKKIDLLIKMDKTQAALVSIERALQENISDTSLYRYAAKIHRDLGNIDEALGYMEHALIIAPDDLAAQGLASELKAACGNYLQADKILKEGRTQEQANAGYHTSEDELLTYECIRCELSLENNNEIAAADALTAALEIRSDHPRVLGNQSRLLTRKGDLDNAAEVLKTALKNIDHIELGRPVSSIIEDLEERETSFSAETYIAVGNAALELHQWGPAMFLLRKATFLAPAEIRSQIELFKAIVKQAEYQYLYEALDSVRNAPGKSAISENTYKEFKSLRKTIFEYKNSVQSKPASPQPLAHDLEEWSIRGLAAFTQDEKIIDKLLNLAPNPFNWASGLRALRDAGNWMRAKEYALDLFNNYRRNVKIPPYLWAQIALTLIGDDEETAYHAAQRAHEASISPRKTEYPLYLVLEARMLERSTEFDKAFQFIDRALSIWEDEPRWHAYAANLLTNTRMSGHSKYSPAESDETALEHLEKACELEPNLPIHHKLLGQCLYEMGEVEKSIEALNKGIELDERDPDLWIALATAHEFLGHTREASIMAKRTIDLDADNIEAMLILARIALTGENYQQALKQTNFVLERQPDDLEAMTIQAWSYSGLGKHTEAINAIDAVLAADAGNIELILERTRIVQNALGVPEARASLEQLLPVVPDHPRIQMELSRLYSEEEHNAMAVQTAQKALKSDNHQLSDAERSNLHLLLGQLLKKAGQLDQSLHHLTKSLEIIPESSEVMLEIGKTYGDRKQYIEALQSFHNAIDQSPDDPRPYYFAGQTYKAMKEYQQAEDMLRKAVDLAPNDLNIHRQLGTVVAINLFQNQDRNSPVYKKSRA